MKRVIVCASVLCFASLAWAAGDNPWPSIQKPKKGPARAIGDYSKGCVQGAVALPLNGDGYQVMRPSRRRYYGHPALVDFVETLARDLKAQTGEMLLVGDLSQPRGGRSNGGHSSHQTGLDVDVWFWHPEIAEQGPLTRKQRERMSARSVVDEKRGTIVPDEKQKVTAVLRLAAQDPRVARIFVHPIIKRELCEAVGGSDAVQGAYGWLRKVRPWHGHDDHFHARLNCPVDSAQCQGQAEVPEGTGCDALGFWFNKKAQAERKKAQKTYQKNVDEGRGWPDACEPLLSE